MDIVIKRVIKIWKEKTKIQLGFLFNSSSSCNVYFFSVAWIHFNLTSLICVSVLNGYNDSWAQFQSCQMHRFIFTIFHCVTITCLFSKRKQKQTRSFESGSFRVIWFKYEHFKADFTATGELNCVFFLCLNHSTNSIFQYRCP